MTVGRPTKYSEEILSKTLDYINNYKDHDDLIPSIAGLSVVLGVRRETLHDWAKQESKLEFSNMLADLLARQEQVLFNKGLAGEFNPTIAKLALTKHGYSDKAQHEVSGPDGQPIETQFTVRIVNAGTDDPK